MTRATRSIRSSTGSQSFRRQTRTSPSDPSARAPKGALRRVHGRSAEGRGFSIPLTLIILLVAFGALVAAGIPLLLGLTAVLGDVGPRRAHQPGSADVRLGQRDHPADRPRGRCRLHDVLLEAGTRRACRGTERRGCTRGGGGDIGPLGADLRVHRPGRHGGHVAHVRPRLRLLRRRDDDRRRGRDARIADGAAGAALQARRQRRPTSRAVRPSTAPRRRGRPDLGCDHRSRPPAPGRVGRPGRRASRGTRGAGVPAPHGKPEHRHVSAEAVGDLQPPHGRVPGYGRRERASS